ncbi:MAG TPA: hypothetical protein VHZ78_04055 [Rhizomicrobium sp.]|jgi:DNA-binding transcriptional regulator YhcF (GntR family)|nr:hypothetical protein [Rhizomicrobium sp.]
MRVDDGSLVLDSAEKPGGSSPANVRAILRVGNEFFLRSIDGIVQAQSGDLIAALIFTALWIGNVRHITHSAANIKFGGIDTIPPDDLRRPVSVQTLSNNLQIPYETVRRYVQAMIRDNVCVRVGKRGVIVPAAVHNQPMRKRLFRDSFPSLLRFLTDLKQAGFDYAPYRRVLASTVPLTDSGELPANGRALLRASMELVMRGVDRIGRLNGGDFLTGMIAMSIWTANVRAITCGRDNLKYGAMNQLPPDALRRPVTVNSVALTLHLPYETTRRYVSALVRDGIAQRVDGKGVIIPSAHFAQPRYYEAARESYQDIVQTVGDLHRAGFDFSRY